MKDQAVRYWHALYVRSRAEKKVLAQLEDMGIQAYLPLITHVKQWSGGGAAVQVVCVRVFK